MRISLAYGKDRLQAELPEGTHIEVVEPRFTKGLENPMDAVRHALRSPAGHGSLHESVGPDQKVGIVFSDITRATPYHLLLPPLLSELEHLPDDHITFFCANGTHRPAPFEELSSILGREVADRFRIVQNNASDRSLFREVGKTRAGNSILLNKEILDQDLRILTGFIEPHFFAGFSGGGKSLMPGMAHVDSIRFNHSIAMLENPEVRWGVTDGNPLWEDIMEASSFASPLFLLNITLNKHKEITGVFAGELGHAHREGCAFARETAMVRLDSPFDIVLTSNSGYPLDLNVYQSVKGMSAAEQVVREKGHIIIAAECWDGIPPNSDYEKILSLVPDEHALMNYIKKNEKQLKDTWQIYFQAKIQSKARVYLHSALDDRTVEKAHLKPVKDITKLVSELVKEQGSPVKICVLPEGPQTIPFLA